jgi:hypothetical protein
MEVCDDGERGGYGEKGQKCLIMWRKWEWQVETKCAAIY